MALTSSIPRLLRERESGRRSAVKYEAIPPRLLLPVANLVSPDHRLLRGITIGFTLCGQFLISYEIDDSTSSHLIYYILLWDFHNPYEIRLYARHRLFASTTFLKTDNSAEGLVAIFQHNLAINICQTSCRPRCIVVQGYVRQRSIEQIRYNFITIIPLDKHAQCFHFSIQSYYPHFSLDKSSASIHRLSTSDQSYQIVFECSIAVRWLRFMIESGVDLSSSDEELLHSNVPDFFSNTSWMKDVSRTANSSGSGSRVRVIDVSGFEPEHFLGQRIVRSNRAGLHVVLKDYSLHLSKIVPGSSESVIILVANIAVKGVPHRPLVITLVVDFDKKSLDVMGGNTSILNSVLSTCQTGAPALVIGTTYCKLLHNAFDSPMTPLLPSECLSNATIFLGRSKQRIDNPVYPYAIISYS